MKLIYCIFTVALLASCSKQNDSKDAAMQQNEMKADSSAIAVDTKADMDFAVNACDAGMTEVKTGMLAATNASSSEVKNFAKMMVADHTAAGDQLKALAAKKNITLPTTISASMQEHYDKLATLHGKAFDKEYADMMESGHKKVVDMFQSEATSGKDADLKAWAANTLPTLQHHLEAATTMQSHVNK